jgi:DNA-binding NtrC family response regulator
VAVTARAADVAGPAAGPLAGRILVVDDEKNIRRALRMVLEGEGAEVLDASCAEDALAVIDAAQAAAEPVHLVVMDVKMGGMSGLDALEALRERGGGQPAMPVIMISGHASVEDAVAATRLGAFDFFEKPLARDRVVVSVRNGLRRHAADRELLRLREALDAQRRAGARGEIIGDSPAVARLLAQIAKVGPTRARVLIRGESGTGKELIARAIHESSERRSAPFVRVNCAAIAPELIESELFGHERGAFTGAQGQKKGLFELADKGTLLLDEIGDMALDAQAKVLRVLQSGELLRVGGQSPVQVDVRVLAATHRDLPEMVATGSFREDLYFRLAVVPIDAPPLRERAGDLPLLVRYFIDQACADNGLRSRRISGEALAALERHDWPGNVRELRNVIERMVILADGDLELADVPDELRGDPPPTSDGAALIEFDEAAIGLPSGVSLRDFREATERVFIRRRLEEHAWNVSRAAESLGLERSHLHRKIKLLGIQRGMP